MCIPELFKRHDWVARMLTPEYNDSLLELTDITEGGYDKS
jgi:hypothetical protein